MFTVATVFVLAVLVIFAIYKSFRALDKADAAMGLARVTTTAPDRRTLDRLQQLELRLNVMFQKHYRNFMKIYGLAEHLGIAIGKGPDHDPLRPHYTFTKRASDVGQTHRPKPARVRKAKAKSKRHGALVRRAR